MRIAALALVSALLLIRAPAVQYRAEPFVPIGVWYGGGTARPPIAPRAPAGERERWRADLQAISTLGFNTITSWIDWAGAEARRGEFRFEALDQMLALADEAGLKVILQLYPDIAPDWIGRNYPDARFVSNEGVRISPDEAPGYCVDHPEVRAAMAAFIEAVSARASKSGAFYALDISSSPRTVNGMRFDSEVRFCYCPQTQRRFREWLQRKYASLDALNDTWQRSFDAWDDVEAPRYVRDWSSADSADWEAFLSVKAHDDLQFMTRASAARGPRPTTSHTDAPSVLLARPRAGAADDWWMGSAVDYYGTAIHPRSTDRARSWPLMKVMFALDGIRSAAGDRGWWLRELQAGPAVNGGRVSGAVTPAELQTWAWAALARGARALSYFSWYPMSAGPNAQGSGLVELDGRLTDRARAAGSLARIISRNPVLFAPMRPRPSKVAMLFNPHSPMGPGREAADRASGEAMLGFYRAMFEHNIQVDFVHADEVAAGRAASYRAVFAGHPFMLQRAVADALGAYVRSGGTLISEARPASIDELGVANAPVPGFGLHEVFGAREKSLDGADSVEILMERELDGPLSTLAGRTIRGIGLAEHLEIGGTNVRVIARFPGTNDLPGDPAIVMARHEKGCAILIGSHVAAAFERDPEAARTAGDLLAALVVGAGVAPDVRLSGGSGAVDARVIESRAATILIAINHTDAPQRVTFQFSADTPEAIWLNLATGTSVNFVDGPAGPTYTYSFGPHGVLPLMINKEYR